MQYHPLHVLHLIVKLLKEALCHTFGRDWNSRIKPYRSSKLKTARIASLRSMATLPETLSGLVRHLSVLDLELSKLDAQLQSEFTQYDTQVCWFGCNACALYLQ